MEKIKFSIIIPVYNCEKYLRKCIDSIINQKYKNFELIIVNDGSTDNSLKIIEEYKKNDNRIILVNSRNGGVSKARNCGLKIASGKYVTFIDADDWIDKNNLFNIYKVIQKNEPDIVKYTYFKRLKFIKKKYKFYCKKINEIIQKSDFSEYILPNIFKTYDYSNVWNAFFKLELLKDIFFDESKKYAEDFKFMIDSIIKSKSIFLYDKAMYNYRINNQSAINNTTTESITKKINDNLEVYQYILEKIGNFYCEDCIERFEKQLNKYILNVDLCDIKNIIVKQVSTFDNLLLKERLLEIVNKFEIIEGLDAKINKNIIDK